MKKIIITIALVLIGLTSCKKENSKECKQATQTYESATGGATQAQQAYMNNPSQSNLNKMNAATQQVNMTYKAMKAACEK